MWLDITHGYVNESTIEYIENRSNGSDVLIVLHTISGNMIEVNGKMAFMILEYARMNKIQLMDKLTTPIGLNGISL